MNDKQLVEKLRQKYMQNPPEGMTTSQVENMSDDDLLDMDYFLNEEFDDDDIGEEGFYIFWIYTVCFSMPTTVGISFFKSSPKGELSYKVKKRRKPLILQGFHRLSYMPATGIEPVREISPAGF